MNSPSSVSRRSLIKWGLVVPFSVPLSTQLLQGCSSVSTKPLTIKPGSKLTFLSDEDFQVWYALLPVLLAGFLPKEKQAEKEEMKTIAEGIDKGIAQFSIHNRNEMRKLHDLLELGVTRGLTTGIWRDLSSASPESIEMFLLDWRNSNLAMLNNAYTAISKLAALNAYARKDNWAASGYPGPPAHVIKALPQFAEENSKKEQRRVERS